MSYVFKGWEEPGSDWYSTPCLNAVASAYWNLLNELKRQPTVNEVAKKLDGRWSFAGVDWAFGQLRLKRWPKQTVDQLP